MASGERRRLIADSWQWPDLLDQLLPCVTQRENAALRHGALRCVQMFAGYETVEQQHLPAVLRALLPVMHGVVASDGGAAFDGEQRGLAVSIFRQCAAWCATAQMHDALRDALAQWCPLLLHALELCAQRVAAGGDAARGSFLYEIEALATLQKLLAHYRAYLGADGLRSYARVLVALLHACVDPYLQLAVADGASGSQQVDADGIEW